MPAMGRKVAQVLVLYLFIGMHNYDVTAEHIVITSRRFVTATRRDLGGSVVDGSDTEHAIISNNNDKIGEWPYENNRVSVSMVAFFTMVMAAATGLGAVPFFFVDLDP